MFVNDMEAPLEAVLFAAGNPVSLAQLSDVLELDKESVQELLVSLQTHLAEQQRGLMLQEVAGGWQLVTRPENMEYVKRLCQIPEKKLSAAALETLAIIAFKQPVTRQEIEDIRGVKADHAVSRLTELDLITDVGRRDAVGRPLLYGTTDTFLRCFGLKNIDDLKERLPLESINIELDSNETELLAQANRESEAAEVKKNG